MQDRARVVDSTALYDAVQTQDTVTQLRAAIRKLLRLLEGSALAAKVRGALSRDDDYRTPGKPPCDWDDPAARDALVDALVRDALTALAVLEGEKLQGAAAEAVELLAAVAGQDVEKGDDATFRITKKVAKDRVISTVDPEPRHGHKSHNRHLPLLGQLPLSRPDVAAVRRPGPWPEPAPATSLARARSPAGQ